MQTSELLQAPSSPKTITDIRSAGPRTRRRKRDRLRQVLRSARSSAPISRRNARNNTSGDQFLPAVKKIRPRGYKRKRAALLLGGSALVIGAQSTGALSQTQMLPLGSDIVQTALVQAEAPRLPALALNPSDALLDAIVEEEGMRYTVYSSVIGNPLVGAGHLILPGEGLSIGDTISHGHAMQLLKADTDRAAEGVRDLVGDLPLYQHEFDALVDLVYNVGIGKVSQAESPMLNAAIAAGDYDGMASQLNYTAAGGQVFGGLEHRSERRAQIFIDGLYDNTRADAASA